MLPQTSTREKPPLPPVNKLTDKPDNTYYQFVHDDTYKLTRIIPQEPLTSETTTNQPRKCIYNRLVIVILIITIVLIVCMAVSIPVSLHIANLTNKVIGRPPQTQIPTIKTSIFSTLSSGHANVSQQPIATSSSSSSATESESVTPSQPLSSTTGSLSGRCHSCTCSSSRCPSNGDIYETTKYGQIEICSHACYSEYRADDTGKIYRGCVSSKGDVWLRKSKTPGCYTIGNSIVCFCCGVFCNTENMTNYQQTVPFDCYQERG